MVLISYQPAPAVPRLAACQNERADKENLRKRKSRGHRGRIYTGTLAHWCIFVKYVPLYGVHELFMPYSMEYCIYLRGTLEVP